MSYLKIQDGVLKAKANISKGSYICRFESQLSDIDKVAFQNITGGVRLHYMKRMNPTRNPQWAVRLYPGDTSGIDAFAIASDRIQGIANKKMTSPVDMKD